MRFLSSCNVGMRWVNTRPLRNPHTKCHRHEVLGYVLPTSMGLCNLSTAQGNVNSGTWEHLRHNDMVTDAAPILDSFQWMSSWLQSFHWMLMNVLARAPLPVTQCAWTCLPMCGLFICGTILMKSAIKLCPNGKLRRPLGLSSVSIRTLLTVLIYWTPNDRLYERFEINFLLWIYSPLY